MATNPLIALQVDTVKPDVALANGLTAYNQTRESNLRNALLQQQSDTAKQAASTASYNEGQKALIQGSFVAKRFLDANDLQGAKTYLMDLRDNLGAHGIPSQSIDQGLQLLEQDPTGQSLKQVVDANVALGIQSGILGERHKQGYGTSPIFFRDPATQKIVAAQGSESGGFYANGKPIPQGYEPIANPNTIFTQQQTNKRFYDQPTVAGNTRQAESNVDVTMKPVIAEKTTTAEKNAAKASEYTNLADTWDVNRSFLVDSIPAIKEAMSAAPGSSLSKVFQSSIGKVIGNLEPADAQATLEQYGAIILQGVPYPPGQQSDKELQARGLVLSEQLTNPNLKPETKVKLIGNFLEWQDTKAKNYRSKANKLVPGSGDKAALSIDDLVNKYAQ